MSRVDRSHYPIHRNYRVVRNGRYFMADSYCEVDFGDASDDADQVEFHVSKTVRAKKEHRCDECGERIEKGEQYRRTVYKFEGEFSMDRCCTGCVEAAAEFHYFIMDGSLWSMFHEEWAQGARLQSCLNRLTSVKAKERMRAQWMKWKKLPFDSPLPSDAVDPVGERVHD